MMTWCYGSTGVTHCSECCPPPPLSPRQGGVIARILADIILRPHMSDDALARVRELRTSRLRQMSQSAGSMADRTFVAAVFRGNRGRCRRGRLGVPGRRDMDAPDGRTYPLPDGWE